MGYATLSEMQVVDDASYDRFAQQSSSVICLRLHSLDIYTVRLDDVELIRDPINDSADNTNQINRHNRPINFRVSSGMLIVLPIMCSSRPGPNSQGHPQATDDAHHMKVNISGPKPLRFDPNRDLEPSTRAEERQILPLRTHMS